MNSSPLIDSQITTTHFACDLQQCKGACCTMPGQRGAPLQDDEVGEIEKWYPVIRKYLTFRHRDTIEERGLIQGRQGDHTTQVVDRRSCVFVVFENSIANCAFEKGFLNHEIPWRKPISCHLFPIRVSRQPPLALRFESIPECKPALERGRRDQAPLWKFLESSLIRAFGEEWYKDFAARCEMHQ